MTEYENDGGEQPATPKQRNYIRYLAGEVALTRAEASKIISQLKKEDDRDELTQMHGLQ